MAYYYDRVKETTTTTGTGAITLAGAAFGCRAFSSVLSNGQQIAYVIEDPNTGAWETGYGTYTVSSNTLTRSVRASSNAGSVVSLTAGTKYVYSDAIAASFVPTSGVGTMQAGALAGGRLTLTSGTPVTTSDTTGSTIYYTPYLHNQIGLYDTNLGRMVQVEFQEVMISIGTVTSGKNYDVFGYLDSSYRLSIEMLAWTNDTTRATALSLDATQGIYIKSGAATRRYLGTFRTISTTTVTDSKSQRFVWNMYNRVRRPLVKYDSAGGYAYNTAAWRAVNGTSSNMVETVQGLAIDSIALEFNHLVTSTGGNTGLAGLSVDGATPAAPYLTSATGGGFGAYFQSTVLRYDDVPAAGYHSFQMQEQGGGTNTTFYGATNGGGRLQGHCFG